LIRTPGGLVPIESAHRDRDGIAEEASAEDVSKADNEQHDDAKPKGDQGADDAPQRNAGE